MSGSGISWAICKSAPLSRQITTPTPHRSVFLQAGCPSCRPTSSVKALALAICLPEILTELFLPARCYASVGTSYDPVTCVCLSVCVTCRCSIETDRWIDLIFGVDASFYQSYTVLQGNSATYKNKGTFVWNFFLNSGLRKFRHGISVAEHAINCDSLLACDSSSLWPTHGALNAA